MAIYGFSDRQTAERCKSLANSLGKNSVSVPPLTDNGSRIFIVAPRDGIPAAEVVPSDSEGFTCLKPGQAEAEVMEIVNRGTVEPEFILRGRIPPTQSWGPNPSILTRTVWNFTQTPIPPGRMSETGAAGFSFCLAVEDSFGRLLVLAPRPVSALIYGLPEPDGSGMTQHEFDGVLALSDEAGEGFQLADVISTLPDHVANADSIQNPLGIPAGTPSFLTEIPGLGRTVLGASPWLYVTPPVRESYPFLRGEVIQAQNVSGFQLFVVQADTDRLPSVSFSPTYAPPVPVLPLTASSGGATAKMTGTVNSNPTGFRSFEYEASTRSMKAGDGPYFYDYGLWTLRTQYPTKGFYDRTAGTFSWTGGVTENVWPTATADIFAFASGDCLGILTFIPSGTPEPRFDSADIKGTWQAAVTPPLRFKEGVSLLFGGNAPVSGGWEPLALFNPPFSQLQSPYVIGISPNESGASSEVTFKDGSDNIQTMHLYNRGTFYNRKSPDG